ncbi:MAG: TonB-dependent receptor plug domain-containing protein, partial [Tannerella sp.]|nr:TonB-dependent receptor plug domain-containing protein [Tannerella sp.]
MTDSIYSLFNKQLQSYPMEKIYVRTDKPYYLAGEDVRFRIYLVDAMSHIPDTISRYVYAELINPWSNLIKRVKIRPVEGAYHGYFELPEELYEGSYEIRFYTRFMENNGEEYYFKRTIDVGDPLSAYYTTKAVFNTTDNGKRIEAEFEFFDAKGNYRIMPEKVRFQRAKGEQLKELKIDGDSVLRHTFDADLKKQVIYLEYDYNGKFHKAFLPLKIENDDFNVQFFPEGGQVPEDSRCKVAFKAVNKSGLGENIKGYILSNTGDTVEVFNSAHRGMGVITFISEKGKTYNAVCKNEKGTEKKIPLPKASPAAVSLSVNSLKERMTVSISHSPEMQLPDSMYLIIHHSGLVLSAHKWDNSKEFIIFNKSELLTGINQILLTDGQFKPLSERLVFTINDIETPRTALTTDKPGYGKREAVNADFTIMDAENRPLGGDFSVSVTDNRDVLPDTTVNILSSMLLTSELKGFIEDPAYYFTGRDNTRSYFLDILMMTQGWRRYDCAELLKGNIQHPKGFLEVGPVVSGKVNGGLLMTTPAKDFPVTLVSFEGGHFDQTNTNDNGQYYFNIPEMPDSSRFIIQATSKKGGARVELLVDTMMYPAPLHSLPLKPLDNSLFADYMEKADQAFTQEFGMRTIYLDEVVVSAKKKEIKGKSSFSSAFNTIVSTEDYERMHPRSIFDILRTLAGVNVTGETVTIRGNSGPPLVLVDDTPNESDILSFLPVEDVDQIEIVKDAGAAIFGSQGGNGVILITTKRGFDQTQRRSPTFNIKSILPLGYQAPKEFYTPVYDTPEAVANKKSDLRTTIYWNPDVKITEGRAAFKFYTADVNSRY